MVINRKRKTFPGFTLVELIVTITILAILGTIAFVQIGWFYGSSRDASRMSDLASISKGLDVSFAKNTNYPSPDNTFTVAYSGGALWYQGTIGTGVINTISSIGAKISKKPTDPLSSSEYVYSKLAYGNAYEIKSDWEGDSVVALNTSNASDILHVSNTLNTFEFSHSSILGIDQASAAQWKPTLSYIKGNYNRMVAKTLTGGTVYVLAVPSIVTSDTGTLIDAMTLSGKLLMNGTSNSGWIAFTPVLVYTGTSLPANDTNSGITNLVNNLKAAYSGSSIPSSISGNSDIQNLLKTTGMSNVVSLGTAIINYKLGGGASTPSWSTPSSSSSYNIGNSLLFNSASSQYLSRTFGAGGNQKKWTWSGWVKRGKLSDMELFGYRLDGNNQSRLHFTSTNELWYYNQIGGSINISLKTAGVFRDPSSWYHVVVRLDATNNTGAIYVNGISQVLSVGSVSNVAPYTNSPVEHRIGEFGGSYGDGYLTDVNFVDSGALDASYFWQTDPTTGQWVPKQFTGDYGKNGFHLDFSSGASVITLGKDSAPISGAHTAVNDWTLNGYSDTSAQMLDSPVNNFATLNPLSTSSVVFSNGNIKATIPTLSGAESTIQTISGKWYFEATITSWNAVGTPYLGIFNDTTVVANNWSPNTAYLYLANGQKTHNWTSLTYGSWWTSWDTVGVAYDLDVGTIQFYKNWISQGQAFSGIVASESWRPWFVSNSSVTTAPQITLNFGQWGQSGLTYYPSAGGSFKYQPPTSFKALSTANLPDPTIKNPKQYFDVLTYTGNGSNQTITGLSFQPDLTWIKRRSGGASHHVLQDSVRGNYRFLFSSSTDPENTTATADWFQSFNSDGFTVKYQSTAGVNTNEWNLASAPYVAWNWKAGWTAVTNNSGTIQSQVNANPTAGFSIVTFNTLGGVEGTVGHSLNSPPKFIIARYRNIDAPWVVYHTAIGPTNWYKLNDTSIPVVNAANANVWTINPTSNVFTIGSSWVSTSPVIAYLWSEVPGFSKFWSYTGNGSSDGPFVYTGFKPRFILGKDITVGQHWFIYDAVRDTYNVVNKWLYSDSSAIEDTTSIPAAFDILSNGFKIRTTNGTLNTSNDIYIYAAFAEAPFKYANAR